MNKYRAHKLELRQVNPIEERLFLIENHYQGYVNSKIAYGLYDGDELLEIMTFGRPRFNNHYGWELLRLATKKNSVVYGGASKLFKYFTENSDISKGIISYCNRDKFDGNVYKILGFNSTKITKGYHYEKDGKIYHRTNFTKQRCLKLWPKYNNQDITESQIMKLEGYNRIEDKIGQELFVYNDPAKYYIYKIEFEDGSTYIGQHIQYKENDNYITSSTYAKNHKIKNREILLYVNDKYTLNLIETLAIMQDKCNAIKNVNGNLGNYIFKHTYNILTERNYSWSEETRKKFLKSVIGHKLSEETKHKISLANKGKKRTAEQCKRISESHKGIVSSFKGKHLSDETKKKLSIANKDKHMKEDVKQQISNTLSNQRAKYYLREDGSIISAKEISMITNRPVGNINQRIKEYGYFPINGKKEKLIIL